MRDAIGFLLLQQEQERLLAELNTYIRELVQAKQDIDTIAVARRLLDIRDGV